MTTRSTSPVVRRYLSSLDRELTKLRPDRAQELRAELVAHLEEMVAPTDDDEHATAAITKLGSPRDIVAEALGTSRPRPWLQRVRKRTWLWLAAIVVVVGAGVAALTVALLPAAMPAPVRVDGFGVAPFGHRVISHESQAGGVTELSIEVVAGHRQGFYLEFFNGTSVTQTLIGLRPGAFVFGGHNSDYRLEFATPGNIPDWDHARYRPGPVDLAPNQVVAARLSWISGCADAGRHDSMTALDDLRVHANGITRTESIYLPEALGLRGTSRHCPGS